MNTKIYLFLTITFLIGYEAKKSKIVSSYPQILNLALEFDEKKINDYVVDSFFATADPDNNKLLHCDVTLSDIIKAVPLKKVTVNDFMKAIEDLNVTIADDDLSNLVGSVTYEDLTAMGLTAGKVYKNIVKTYFKDTPLQLLQCLNILGIAPEFATAYTFGTDKDIFNTFQNANLSYYNLAEVAKIINIPTTLKDLVSALGLKKINQVYLANFLNSKVSSILFERGLTEENLRRFLQSFSLSISSYKGSKAFKECYSTLTKNKPIAVAISANEIVTNDDTLISKYINLEKYTLLSAEIVEDSSETYTISADNIIANESDNIIRMKTSRALYSYVPKTGSYADVQNKLCYYITVDDDEVLVQNTTASLANDQLSITKTYNTVFKKGSPLICDQKLYGLASINRLSSIVFDCFETSQSEEETQTADNSKLVDAIKQFFEHVLGDKFDICKYTNCTNGNKEQGPTSNAPEEDKGTNEVIVGNNVTQGEQENEEVTEGSEASSNQENVQGNGGEQQTESSSDSNSVPADGTQENSSNQNEGAQADEPNSSQAPSNNNGESDNEQTQEVESGINNNNNNVSATNETEVSQNQPSNVSNNDEGASINTENNQNEEKSVSQNQQSENVTNAQENSNNESNRNAVATTTGEVGANENNNEQTTVAAAAAAATNGGNSIP